MVLTSGKESNRRVCTVSHRALREGSMDCLDSPDDRTADNVSWMVSLRAVTNCFTETNPGNLCICTTALASFEKWKHNEDGYAR